MPNLLQTFTMQSFRPRRDSALRRVRVPVPTPEDNTDAIFLMMRRMRGPLIMLIVVFSVCVLGMALTPGADTGHGPTRMTLFEAFYVVSYTATTIGFGELPTTFTTAQRMWMTLTIYLTVTVWAYSIGAVFSLVQDSGFRRAIARQRFGTKVKRLREPFYLVVGYGNAGRALAASLDHAGKRIVVLDTDPQRIDMVLTDQLRADVPALATDPHAPANLGLGGLGHPQLAGVMAMTDDDQLNLGVVMAAHLLREDVSVVTRCTHRENVERMRDFRPDAIINPYDRYGHYLLLALSHPVTHQLVAWLLQRPDSPLPPAVQPKLTHGLWVVYADGLFGEEVARDLQRAGLQVRLADPQAGIPDVSDAAGLVAGSGDDTLNLSAAAAARLEKPDIYLSVRQRSAATRSLMQSFAPDQVFIATDLVAFEALARVEAPNFWGFIEYAMNRDDDWSRRVLEELRARVGDRTPIAQAVTLDAHTAPAVCRWLRSGHTLTLGQLLSDPNDRSVPLEVFAIGLVRDGEVDHVPASDTELRVGDTVALLTRNQGFDLLNGNLVNDTGVEYLATGVDAPTTWVGRWVSAHVHRNRDRSNP